MTHFTDAPRLPVIDLALFEIGNPWRDHVAAQIDWAAAEFGIFRVLNHGIDPALGECLIALGRRYLSKQGGHGPPGGAASVAALEEFAQALGFHDVVRDYVRGATGLARRLLTSFARGLHLEDTCFADRYAGDAGLELAIAAGSGGPGAGEPPLLSLLEHDEAATLEVRHAGRLIEVPHVPGALICAVGESLERLTRGRYRAAPYRLAGPAHEMLALSFHFGAGSSVMEEARAA